MRKLITCSFRPALPQRAWTVSTRPSAIVALNTQGALFTDSPAAGAWGARGQGFSAPRGQGGNRGGRGGRGNGFGNNARPGGRGGDFNSGSDRAPRRAREDYLQDNATDLFNMKRDYKTSKSSKERRNIEREARRLIRRTRIDPSTQDEKSISIYLNCAATFQCNSSEGIEQAVSWTLRNLHALTPQNIALFANALGVIQPPEVEKIMTQDVAASVQATMKEMTPVEVVMVLQAYSRCRIHDCEALQDDLLKELAPSIATMPTSQLSTLATVLGRSTLRTRNKALWEELATLVMETSMKTLDKAHSKDVITLLECAPFLPIPQKQVADLVQRATETAHFHTDEQVGDLFRALCNIRKEITAPEAELTQRCAALETALVERLDRVGSFVTMPTAITIWRFSHEYGVELPAAVQEKMCDAVMRDLTYSRRTFASIARFARTVSTQKLPRTDLLVAACDCCVGVRPARPVRARDDGHNEAPSAPASEDPFMDGGKDYIFGRFAGDLTMARVNLESALSFNGATEAPRSLAETLPRHLAEHIQGASPRQLLKAAQSICRAQPCALRNDENDAVLLAKIEARLESDPEGAVARLSPASVTRFTQAVAESPRAEKVVAILKAKVQDTTEPQVA